MEQFRLPSPLMMTGNLGENWRQWEQSFQIYTTVSDADGKDEKIKVAGLLHARGEESLEVYNTLDIDRDEEPSKKEMFLKSRNLNASFWAIVRPTNGAFTVFLALHTCDIVSTYGFMTEDYKKYSNYYFQKTKAKVVFYANHDYIMEKNTWKKTTRQQNNETISKNGLRNSDGKTETTLIH